MSDQEGTNVPVYFPPGEESFLETFDDAADGIQDRRRYSRSSAIREAMELYVEAINQMDKLGWDVEGMSQHGRRATIRQALITLDESEEP